VPEQRTCRVPGCTATHKRTQFCCRSHWYQLPKHLRDAIWTAYREHGVLSYEYLLAAENADAFLEDRDAEDVGEVFA
jgi:hypothetical protein